MILHPGILALLLGSLLVCLLLGKAAYVGWQVMRHWRPSALDEKQLELERRTELVSTLAHHALAIAMFSLPLFVFTADDIYELFIGAMCATGTLNAAPYGWAALLIKVWLFFLGGMWMMINYYDRRVESAPLLHAKFFALIGLFPLGLIDLLLSYTFFTGLRPKVITSCCGSLFSSSADNLGAELAGMPVTSSMTLFFVVLVVYALVLIANLRFSHELLRYLVGVLAGVFFLVGIVAILSFVSLYIYQLPTHHCPFDMLQGRCNFIGYPLYLGLFGTTLCGLAPGLLQLTSRLPGMSEVVLPAMQRWVVNALVFLALFCGVAFWPMMFGPLKLLE